MTGPPLALIRGGGDLATGVVARLHRTGFSVLVTELPQPLALRRLVAAAEAVYADRVEIEDLQVQRIEEPAQASAIWERGAIPVLVDPAADSIPALSPQILVDGRMRKEPPEIGREAAPLVIGIGPGFTAGVDCHAVIEAQRGHHLGRVIWQGQAAADSGVPEPVSGHDVDRVLRAPGTGQVEAGRALGEVVEGGERLAVVGERALLAPFRGALRGLIHDGVEVRKGDKMGDLDPRGEPSYCHQISDKSLAIGGGVLEAVLSRPELRRQLGG